ncbi:MAG: hypothetical protein PHO67_06010 [Candidatus Omnitrophica bacterium]|nr:hypothetical protein [Candidatus Omnitrophota bacterium]
MQKSYFKVFLITLYCLSFFLSSSSAENLVLNGSFEETLDNKNPGAAGDYDAIRYWLRWFHQNSERSELAAHSGRYSFKAWAIGGIFQNFAAPIEKGKTYQINCYMYTPGKDRLKGASYGLVKLEWLNADGIVLNDLTVRSPHFDSNMSPDTWHLMSVQGVAPENAVNGRVSLEFVAAQKSSGVILWDDVEAGIPGGGITQSKVSKEEVKKEEAPKEVTPKEKEDGTIDWEW